MRSLLKRFGNGLMIHRHVHCSSSVLSPYRNKNYNNNNDWRDTQRTFCAAVLMGFIGYHLYEKQKDYLRPADRIRPIHVKVEKLSTEHGNWGKFREGLPQYSMEEISKHTSMPTGIWLTYKEGVYDVTKYVNTHPGGKQILMAAGTSADPFFKMYSIHELPSVLELLETFRIGNTIPREHVANKVTDMSNPFANEPIRHLVLQIDNLKPFIAECPPSLLFDSFLTPNEFFFVRNHFPVPDVDVKTYKLQIQTEGKEKCKSFSLDDLKKMPKYSITTTMMCAGNRRSEMSKVKPIKAVPLGPGVIGTAKWSGVRLRDLLRLVGVDEEEMKYKHVQFEGIDADLAGNAYGSSIHIRKALDRTGEVIIAYEMNDVELSRDHGFPLRVVAPGIAGARCVKWLAKIIVSENESEAHYHTNEYKGFSPSTDWKTVDFSKAPAAQELPVISAICQPSNDEIVKVVNGHVVVKGYAYSGGGRKIIRVDITTDHGKTWQEATFHCQEEHPSEQQWAWTLWSLKIPVKKCQSTLEIWAKAVDSSYNSQPESFENIWNLRGVFCNAYHRVKIILEH